MASKPPSFPFYGQDFQTGTMAFTPAERGVYIDCLWHQWASGGVPADEPKRLAQVMRCTPADAKKYWTALAPKFTKGDDGLYRNPRLEVVRANKEEWQSKASERGAKGAAARWSKDAPSNAVSNAVSNAQALPEAMAKPMLGDGSSLSLSSVATQQTEPRVSVLTHAKPAQEPRFVARRPNPYGHALVKAPNGSVFWEGPIFDIPDGWARKALKASNGKATEAEIVAFAKALTARLERDKSEAPAQGFLGWLDDEWAAFRRPKVSDGYRPASEVLDENARVRAAVDAAEAKAKADGTYRTFSQIQAEIAAERRAARPS